MEDGTNSGTVKLGANHGNLELPKAGPPKATEGPTNEFGTARLVREMTLGAMGTTPPPRTPSSTAARRP